jgi:hypothetical protein
MGREFKLSYRGNSVSCSYLINQHKLNARKESQENRLTSVSHRHLQTNLTTTTSGMRIYRKSTKILMYSPTSLGPVKL